MSALAQELCTPCVDANTKISPDPASSHLNSSSLPSSISASASTSASAPAPASAKTNTLKKHKGKKWSTKVEMAFDFPLKMYDFLHCDPKRCTGALLARRKLMISTPLSTPFSGIVLSPFGSQTMNPGDLEIVLKNGICVVDCSWARLEEVPWRKLNRGGGGHKGGASHASDENIGSTTNHRLLPFMVAVNPTNYGKVSERSEAKRASLLEVLDRPLNNPLAHLCCAWSNPRPCPIHCV